MRATCLAILLLVMAGSASAQQPVELRVPHADSVQVMVLNDGSRHVGRIQEVAGDEVVFATTSATIRIPRANIRTITAVPATLMRNGEYWAPSPNSSRLFFAPTARMLEKGAGYFADHWVFFPSVTYGVSSNVTMGGGMSIIPGAGFDEQLYFITPKVGLKAAPGVDVAAGALVVQAFNHTAGIGYVVGTFGGELGGVTAGIGYGFADGSLSDRPALMLGADRRVSRRVALITENWWLGGDTEPVISYGIRFLGERLSADLGMITVLGEDMLFPGVPLIGFAFGF